MEETEKALTLEQWFDAGLCLGPVVKSKKMPPGGYEVAAWSEDVPFLKHLRTGVVLWPIRFNLLPFFEALEGQMAYRRLVAALSCLPGPWPTLSARPSEVCRASLEPRSQFTTTPQGLASTGSLPDLTTQMANSLKLMTSRRNSGIGARPGRQELACIPSDGKVGRRCSRPRST